MLRKNLLAKTLFPLLSKMCSDLQKSRPAAGHGVSIAHSLHICGQKEEEEKEGRAGGLLGGGKWGIAETRRPLEI